MLFTVLKRTLLAALFLASSTAMAQWAIIVHPSNQTEITERLIQNLYLGRTNEFADGQSAEPLDLDPKDPLHEAFLRTVVRQRAVQYRRHWSQTLFTGGGEPPEQLSSQMEVVRLVSENPAMIGYVHSDQVTDNVRVVLRFQ